MKAITWALKVTTFTVQLLCSTGRIGTAAKSAMTAVKQGTKKVSLHANSLQVEQSEVGTAAVNTATQGNHEVISQTPKFKIFTYWDYPHGPGPLIELNLKTWLAHSPPGTEIVKVNDTNFAELVPDAPAEWSRMPYAAAKSDMVRAAVLYHHGGLYMDTDFVVMAPLEAVIAKLDKGWDVVVYTDEGGQKETGQCQRGRSFATNFMAAKPGNQFLQTWWENMKLKLTRICGEGDLDTEKICCHEAFDTNPEQRKCRIPWAYLEHLKFPFCDHEFERDWYADCPANITTPRKRWPLSPDHPARQTPEAKQVLAAVERGNVQPIPLPENLKLFCLAATDGLAPHLNGEIYYQPWDAKKGTTDLSRTGKNYDLRFACREKGTDLHCDRGNWGNKTRHLAKFFQRTAYHLFHSVRKIEAETAADIFHSKFLLSEMYRRSLGLNDF